MTVWTVRVVWLVLAGGVLALAHLLAAALAALLLTGSPFVPASLQMARYSLWPFEAHLDGSSPGWLPSGGRSVLWLLGAGWWLALLHVLLGLVLCLTVVGLPFGVLCLSLAPRCLAPFGTPLLPGEASRVSTPRVLTPA